MKPSTELGSELEIVMAQINVTLKTTLRWWVSPLMSCAAVWYWLSGRDKIAPGFIDWVVKRGVRIEVE
jgi:hypothetical protein